MKQRRGAAERGSRGGGMRPRPLERRWQRRTGIGWAKRTRGGRKVVGASNEGG